MKRLAAAVLLGTIGACSQPSVRGMVEWPAYGGDPGGMKYSPLADINRGNVVRLTSAWAWETGEQPIAESDSTKAARPGMFQTTPIMVNDTLYFSTPFNRVVALDPTTGAKYWEFDPEAYRPGQPSNGTGFVHRGVAMWSDGTERRIFINSRWRLIALNAATGQPISTFGSSGEVDLTSDLSRPVEKRHYTNTSPPVVWHDLVIVGNGVGDRLVYKGDPPGDVQAFDVRTGKRMWRFRTVPEPGDSGNATWEKESWRYVGHTNVWAPFTVDTARGYLYLPVGTPSNDWYGGRRLGANLYAESIVCLDARSGQRVWHYQITHHGLWDYDLPAPPNLVTINVGGSSIDAVVVPTKQGWIFVFDRQTGRPVWPIEERPVPASDVPGERAWPTQPFPSLPAPVAVQGFGPDDVLDYTPEIKAAALAELNKYVAGPMYSPPSEMGTVTMPGSIGGVGWGGAAFDPETNTLFVKASNSPSLWRLVKQATKSDTVDDTYMADLRNSSLGVRLSGGPEGTERDSNATPLPLNKPPYGTLTAIDLNTGEHKWHIPIGDTPDVRRNPALAGVQLPPALGVSGAPGGLATKGGLVFITGGGHTLYAIDSNDGHVRWQTDLGQRGYANPMTYRTKAGKQFVLIATGGPGPGAKLQAFALP
ncbi:MAG TPA: pyrroloquinoline quinone-dependent dehydrogenase [Gemmatimonadaceae bacterium]